MITAIILRPMAKPAILEAVSHNPDVVLLDLGLPDIDGVDIIKKIRSCRACLLL